jgi:hypothetical protein
MQMVPGRGIIVRQPKTPGSRRAVALSPDSLAVLRDHRRHQLEERLLLGPAYQDRDLVFATPLGTPIDPANLRRAWRGIVKRAGIGHIRFHDLRHTHATLLLRQGVHPKIVSERLGHASIAITLDIYSHVLPGLQAAAAAGLDALVPRLDALVGNSPATVQGSEQIAAPEGRGVNLDGGWAMRDSNLRPSRCKLAQTPPAVSQRPQRLPFYVELRFDSSPSVPTDDGAS